MELLETTVLHSASSLGFDLSRSSRMERLLLLLLMLVLVFCSASAQSLNSTSLEKFVDELPRIPVLYGFRTDQDGNHKPGNLTIGMFQTLWKFHRDLPSTKVFAYGATRKQASVPGPTIEARLGVPVEVLWENYLPAKHILPIDKTITTAAPKRGGVPTVVHLHGGMNEPESDGHAQAWFTSGFQETGPTWSRKSFFYHNAQGAGNLWYHDHAMGFTRTNILAGLSGAYVVRDPERDKQLNLPCGDEFDRVLLISDRDFNRDGSIFMTSRGNNPEIHPEWQPEYFGSTITVNGKVWPYLRVERRKYRFRIINSSNARFYQLGLGEEASNRSSSLRFFQVGSDAFYLPKVVKTRSITVAPSEIHDVVIDFRRAHGDVLLRNSAPYPFPSGDEVDANTGVVMKFLVEAKGKNPTSGTSDSGKIPTSLAPFHKLRVEDAVVTRSINLYEFVSSTDEPTHLYINAVPFDAPVTETPKAGSTELWDVINLTEDNHPLHIHLAGFQVVSETKLKNVEEFRSCLLRNKNQITEKCRSENFLADGKRRKPVRNEAGWKNVYKMKPSYLTRILVRFSAIDGTPYPFDATAEPGYAYHCHILDHEDNEMMRPFKLVK